MCKIEMKTVIACILFIFLIAEEAFSNSDTQPNREIEIRKPEIISVSNYDINNDGRMEAIEIVLKKGEKINEDDQWCGGGERWEGDFIVQVRKEEKVLSQLSLNDYMGETKHEKLSFWSPKFTLVFMDYNLDGDIDFNLGQYSICEGNDYWLFTIRNTGKIEPLAIEDVVDWLFIQDPRHINSTERIQIDSNGLLKHSTYERDTRTEYITWYKWNGKKFIVAKEEKVTFNQ